MANLSNLLADNDLAKEGDIGLSGGVLVSALPAASGRTGHRYIVTDASATTFHSIVAGSGSNIVPVFSDGTNWRIG